MGLTLLLDSPLLKAAHSGPFLVTQYQGNSTLQVLDDLERVQSALIQQYPRLSTLTVIRHTEALTRVDEEVRHRSVELGKKFDPHLLGAAIVVTARGLAAVVARTFLSGFFLLSRNEAPTRTFPDVPQALEWLRALPGQDLSVKADATLLAELERFLQ